MAAATVTRRIATADPSVEVVVLTVSDGESFTSEKFSNVQAVQATLNEDVEGFIDCTYNTNGAVITVSCATSVGVAVTDKLATLTIWGN